jgi:hypothetical protein
VCEPVEEDPPAELLASGVLEQPPWITAKLATIPAAANKRLENEKIST